MTLPAWGQHCKLSHWLKHATIPVLLLLGLLALPYPWQQTEQLADPLMTVVLQPQEDPAELDPKSKPPEPEPAEPTEPPEPMPVEPVPPLPVSEPPPQPKARPEPSTSITAPEPTQSPEAAAPEHTDTSSLSAGDIMLMAKSRTSIEITEEFTARAPNAKNFYIPEQEIQNWLDDIPFLDESVDRPTIEMRFYAEGLEGQIEKFFDKITISKTFTTKYGTKIHCALIGVIAACSWK